MAKIQRKRIKVLRKMYKARKNVEIKGKRRDIIEDYANFGSTVYAPITRDGLSLDKKANKYEVQPEALSSYLGIEELSRSLPNKVFNSKISIDFVNTKFKKSLSRQDIVHLAHLQKAQNTINIQLQEQAEKEQEKNDEDKKQNIMIRPTTPVFKDFKREEDPFKLADNERKRRATILLQRLIRGRAK